MLPILLALAAPPAEAAPVDAGGLTYEIVDVTDVKIGTGGVEATVVLELTRTGWPSLVFQGASFDLIVSGDAVGTATSDRSVKLKRGEAERVEVACKLSALESLGAALGSLLGGDTVSFTMEGEATGRIWIFPKTYAIESDLITL